MSEPPRRVTPHDGGDAEREILACWALEITGDPELAKRLLWIRVWRLRYRPGANGYRVIHGRGWPEGHRCSDA